jgi:glutamate synthase domain-containing protein 2/glutamate synthase domain-containing protein 1/glutamate synthase domain-containing protein 3
VTSDCDRFPLYDPAQERDACGVGFVADTAARPRRDVVALGLTALARMAHRGGSAVVDAVDGCGLLAAIPWRFVEQAFDRGAGRHDARALGMFFMPAGAVSDLQHLVESAIADHGASLVAWRAVRVDREALPAASRDAAPAVWQALVTAPHAAALERRLYRARLAIEARVRGARIAGFAIVSLSTATVVYKALALPADLPRFYPDLADPRFVSPFAVFHQRFSTNTSADWSLAQPFRVLAHNGEINTIAGNRLWLRARAAERMTSAAAAADRAEARLEFEALSARQTGSDSQSLDAAADALRLRGCALPHAIARLVPPAWERDRGLPDEVRAFHTAEALASDAWEGPAALIWADGRYVGASLDRNGFRPARILRTADGLLAVASEVGVLDVPDEEIVDRGRLGPGETIALDLHRRVVQGGGDLVRQLAQQQPYRRILGRSLRVLPSRVDTVAAPGEADLRRVQTTFGWSREDVDVLVGPMAREAHEPVGSMGDDAPPAVLSAKDRPLTDYFRQRFAQVTNPPLDPYRESCVMSLRTVLGPRGEVAQDGPVPARIQLSSPILSPSQLDALLDARDLAPAVLDATCPPSGDGAALAQAVDRLADTACDRVRDGSTVIVLSDRGVDAGRAPLPAPLVAAAVHHRLVLAGLRLRASLVVDTGDVRDAHTAAVLIAYGAAAVCPRVAFATVASIATDDRSGHLTRYLLALQRGLLKILSKMGVCTIGSYCGAQLFDTLGLDRALVARYFPGTPAPLGGIGLDAIAAQIAERHARAYGHLVDRLPHHGLHGYRRDGEYHATNPLVVRQLHRARDGGEAYREFTTLVHARPAAAVRDLLDFAAAEALPIERVEPAADICRRFFASAMSVGALSPETHRVIATAMNQIGARSNSGEGGEEPDRYRRPAAGDWTGSRTKQVASARFGVTPAYLRSADELQIKIAQGSKPGEGGQLPGDKVVAHIAALRHARPGTPLISPPVHHDIYSIEDLAQLIVDLRTLHPQARLNVKLVAGTGIGVIAAGVVKAGADAIQISGHDGGTGASPRGSIKHAGLPWELGLAEAHQVLVHHGLRHLVRLQTDGGLKTGRDIAIAAALGADEYGFGTAALVAVGCVMARQCHLNTCPVGIASQRPDLRAKFTGTPDMLVGYLTLVAEDVRAILARLGLRSIDELVGRADLLRARDDVSGRPASLDVTPLLVAAKPQAPPHARHTMRRHRPTRAAASADRLDRLSPSKPLLATQPIANTDRAFGAHVAGAIAARFGDRGLPDGSVRLHVTGSAGQSFGAFAVPGMRLVLTGDANDYVGKGMHGGEIVVRPHPRQRGRAHQVLAGNTALYGATGGRLFVAGRAGERFAVRNSGATAVVEGIGDHGCEYMTGGTVVVLGPVGVNFAAGMSGGVAYVLDPGDRLGARCNPEATTVAAIDARDRQVIRALVEAHLRATGSRVARQLLRAGDEALAGFRKIAPEVVEAPAASEVRAVAARA